MFALPGEVSRKALWWHRNHSDTDPTLQRSSTNTWTKSADSTAITSTEIKAKPLRSHPLMFQTQNPAFGFQGVAGKCIQSFFIALMEIRLWQKAFQPSNIRGNNPPEKTPLQPAHRELRSAAWTAIPVSIQTAPRTSEETWPHSKIPHSS